jgi:glyoxylase-like metal-dependent hydrolase (beta-lactamase superfamily II)
MQIESRRVALGDILVETIADMAVMELPLSVLMPSIDAVRFAPYLDWMEPDHFFSANGDFRLACHGFVIRHGGKIILIDTCVGCGKARPHRPAWHLRTGTGFLDRLSASGIAPEQVDTVMCTHLHADHVGWNTMSADGHWVPTFPNARYLIGRIEMAHWQSRAEASRDAEAINHGAFADSVLPVVAAGQVDLVDDGFEIAPGMQLRLLAGHTPGQMGLEIQRGAVRALFCGDALHSPIQVPHPEWSTAFCEDPLAAAATRHAIVAHAAETGQLIFPIHLRGTPFLRVVEHAGRFLPVLQR